MLEKIGKLTDEYNACLKRIRLCNQPIKHKRKRSDIQRIFYVQGKDGRWEAMLSLGFKNGKKAVKIVLRQIKIRSLNQAV